MASLCASGGIEFGTESVGDANVRMCSGSATKTRLEIASVGQRAPACSRIAASHAGEFG